MCPRTLSDRYDQTETDRALWFFLLDHNGQTQIYRLVSGQSDAWLWRNRNFPAEDDDLEKCSLKLCRTATIKPRQIEPTVFFTGQQRTHSSLQTGLRSIGCWVPEATKSCFLFLIFWLFILIFLKDGFLTFCHPLNPQPSKLLSTLKHLFKRSWNVCWLL